MWIGKIERPRYRELVLNKLTELGAGDIRSRIETERIVTPTDWDTNFELIRAQYSAYPTPGLRCCICGRAIASMK